MRNEMTRSEIVYHSVTFALNFRHAIQNEEEAVRRAAEKALDLAGYSDATPQSSPRSLDFSPRMPGKKGEFGPTETRKAEE